MKKLFCLIFSFLVISSCAYAVDAAASTAARKELEASAANVRTVCQRVQKGLRYEYIFLNFFNNECAYYLNQRLRVRDAIFPLVNNIEEGYNEQYPKLSTDFIIDLDKKQIEYFQSIVENYCKYNMYRVKEQSACSAASIKSYFTL